jgi:hypothetical protein
MSSYLFLWTEVHERGVVEEIWDPGGIYISIPAIKIMQTIFNNIEKWEKLAHKYGGLWSGSVYFSICLIKWLLSHRPARERNPHLLQNENSLFKYALIGIKENWLIIFIWWLPRSRRRRMLLDRQTYQGYPRCNLTNGSVSGQISGGFTIQPSMPVLPFIEKLSICF